MVGDAEPRPADRNQLPLNLEPSEPSQLKSQIPPLDRVRRPRAHRARQACSRCSTTDAVIVNVGGQATVRCSKCQQHLYNAPRTETGERPRTVRTLRRAIRPAQQARILNRDRGRCVLCGTAEDLTLGHLLSLEEGAMLGATEHELNSDSNLAAMCEACNLGLRHGDRSVTPRTFAVLVWRLVQAEQRRPGHNEPRP